MPLHVYRHIRAKAWSLRERGKVVGHVPTLILKNVTFVVGPAGRDRVRSERVKHVHAYAKGERTHLDAMPNRPMRRVRYDPYTCDTFVTTTGEPVFKAALAYFCEDGKVFIQEEE